MLPPELLKQIRSIEIKARHLATDALSGEYISAFRGQGMEFDEVREYIPGDDVRSIDWNVTARMNQPYVKIFQEEREMTLMLLVDVSPSQDFGSTDRTKNEVAAEIAAVLAFLATRNNDKVGLILFSDHIEQYFPPRKGRGHIWNIIRGVLTHEGGGRGTDLKGALQFLTGVSKRKALCFLVSDFYAPDYFRDLQTTAGRHDLVCVRVEDRRERTLPGAGLVDFIDSETGRQISLDTSSRRFRSSFTDSGNRFDTEFSTLLRRQGIDSFSINTSEPVTRGLLEYIRRREHRSYR